METFIFDQILEQSRSDKGIPVCHFKDYILQEQDIDPNNVFVAPGFVISQDGGMIRCSYTNGLPYFSVKCDVPLTGIRVRDQTCYGIDDNHRVHIFPFEQNQPTILRLSSTPKGWCVVPKTKYILHWDIVNLTVTNTGTGEHDTLRGHYAAVLCGDASTSIAVSGDRSGYLCIWYVASWERHYNIKISHQPCLQTLLHNDLQVAIRTRDRVFIYDVTTGKCAKNIAVTATCIQWCSLGLVVATSTHIQVYNNGDLHLCFEYATNKLVAAKGDRIWSISKRKLAEFRFYVSLWSEEIVNWTKQPTFPCPCEHWPKRYLEVLAISASQWVPRVETWNPPKIWLRHEDLRNAIWDSILDCSRYDYASSWEFLPTRIKRVWYNKCEDLLLKLVQDKTYCAETAKLVCATYTHLRLKSSPSSSNDILRWCWLHHNQVALRSVLIYFTEHDFDGEFMQCISSFSSSPDAILCFTSIGADLAFQNGWFLIFLKWMLDFHAAYPYEPTHHMREIYTSCVLHIYNNLTPDTYHVPLLESGHFQPMKRLNPSHKNAYVRQGTTKGFITLVEFGETNSALWCPIGKHTSEPLDVNRADIWVYHDTKGPRTMLECALTIMNEDLWSWQSNRKPWSWFQSHLGAFLCIGKRIDVLDDVMTITKAGYEGERRYVITNVSLKLYDSDNLDVEWVTGMWSYVEECMYHIIPLRLKICHCLSGDKQLLGVHVDTSYAAEITQCMSSPSVRSEHVWTVETNATAMVSDTKAFFVGTRRGTIYEYDNMACMGDTKRTFEGHTSPIRKLYIMGMRLVSMCEEQINVWDLRSGMKSITIETENKYVDVVPLKNHTICLIDEFNDRHSFVVWSLVTETLIRRIDLPESEYSALLTICDPEPSILISNVLYALEKDAKTRINVHGDITCIVGADDGIFGGTSEGHIFMVDKTGRVQTCPLDETKIFTAVDTILETNVVVLGTTDGTIYIWDCFFKSLLTKQKIGTSPIHCLHSHSMFCMVACKLEMQFISIVPDKVTLVVHALNTVMAWSNAWKTRLLKDAKQVLEPAIVESLDKDRATKAALRLLEVCTEEYEHRAMWCSSHLVDALLQCSGTEAANNILHRLASFRGPRFDCAICADEERYDSICYLKTCHHRFHSGCIGQLIRKTPEYNDEMQYDYALTYSLRCPICRTSFSSEDVGEDTLLNKYLYIPYTSLKN